MEEEFLNRFHFQLKIILNVTIVAFRFFVFQEIFPQNLLNLIVRDERLNRSNAKNLAIMIVFRSIRSTGLLT